jgi:rhodanese-related sulfurtransferase
MEERMLKFEKLTYLASAFMVGMLLLAACVAEESPPTPLEETISSQVTVEAAAASAAGETGDQMAEEVDVVATSEPASESQVPTARSEVPRVTVEELKGRIDKGEAIVVGDTRSQGAFNLGHIPGAILATQSQVESHLDQIPFDQEIILYCTWPNEESSAGAALTLYKNGYTNVSVLLGGFDEWRDAGYPVEES